MKIGGFVSAAGGLSNAIDRAELNQFDVAMFFIGSPQSWRLPTLADQEVSKYQDRRKKSSISSTYAHALYLANLATADDSIRLKSIDALAITMQNGNKIGLDGVIFHLGSHRNTSTEQGLDRVVDGMKVILSQTDGPTQLIMENSVQQGDKVGTQIAELGYVLKQVSDPRVSVCFDTCHGFAMGYDYQSQTSLTKLIHDINQEIGLDKIKCFHTNDSQGELGSQIDRHANIGEGYIGLDGFRRFLNTKEFADKDFILETPGIDGNGPSKTDRDLLLSLLHR